MPEISLPPIVQPALDIAKSGVNFIGGSLPRSARELRSAELSLGFDPISSAQNEIRNVLVPRARLQAAAAMQQEHNLDILLPEEMKMMDTISKALREEKRLLYNPADPSKPKGKKNN